MKIRKLFISNIFSKTILQKKSPGHRDVIKAEIKAFMENERIAYATLTEPKTSGLKKN